MSSVLVSQTSSKNQLEDQLGIDPATIITGAGSLFKGVKSLFGGSNCSEAQNQQKQQMAQDIQQYLTSQDMQELVRGTESNIAPNPAEMADFFVGGADCLHKNVTPGDQRFLNELPRRIQQRKQEARSQAQSQVPATAQAASLVPAGDGVPLMWVGGALAVAAVGGGIWYFTTQNKKKKS